MKKNKHPFPSIRITVAASSIAALALSGCADSDSYDVHAVPRETQTWENVDLSGKTTEQLLAHLKILTETAKTSAQAGEYIEFHHLEVAMTPALEALAAQSTNNPAAQATIESIKPLATKLHIAGHDGNVTQGEKLSAAISKLVEKLDSQLP